MSWSVGTVTTREDAVEAIDALQPPYELSEGAATQLAAAKEGAKCVVPAVARDDKRVSVTLAGHAEDPGTMPTQSVTISVLEASPLSP